MVLSKVLFFAFKFYFDLHVWLCWCGEWLLVNEKIMLAVGWVMLEIQIILQKKITNFWCSEWLLVIEKVMLMMGLDENQ